MCAKTTAETNLLAEIATRSRDLVSFDEAEIGSKIASLGEEQLLSLVKLQEVHGACLDRILRVQSSLESTFTEKQEIIRMMLACTIAQVPMIILGPPGTAKSALVRAFCQGMGLRETHDKIERFEASLQEALRTNRQEAARGDTPRAGVSLRKRPLFEYLVTRYTTPEEILGTANIDAMLTLSLFYRQSEGMLPASQIAFLDEIFKANSAILNSLLSIISERIYYNAGRAFDVDLLMVFGASNEAPEGEDLRALYDRFPIRTVSEPVRDDHVPELLRSSIGMAYRQGVAPGGDGAAGIPRLCSVNDFRLLSRLSFVMFGGQSTLNDASSSGGGFNFLLEFRHLFMTLREEFHISDRTPERLIRVAGALALLDRVKQLQPAHLRVFKYCAPDAESARVLADIVEETIAGL